MDSIVIAVRCARQKYGDLKLELNINWTVRDLKDHIQAEHASKPLVSRQKLIYAGQLMKDEVKVMEYLKRIPDTDLPIVHFVYTPDLVEPLQKEAFNNSATLRQRRPPQNSPSLQGQPPPPQSSSSSSANFAYDYYQNMANMMMMNASMTQNVPLPYVQSNPNFSQGMNTAALSAHLSTQQNNLAQQQAAYVSQYYQYLQQIYGGQYAAFPYAPYGHVINNQAPPTVVVPNAPMQPAPAAAPLQQQQVAANPIRNDNFMAGDDDDGAGLAGPGGLIGGGVAGRDILDVVYMLLRSSVLFLVLFAYSSFERTALVMFVFFLFFAYQNGWFSRRRPPQQQQQQAAAAQEDAGNNDNNNNRIGERDQAADQQVNQGEQPQAAVVNEQRENTTAPSSVEAAAEEESAWHVFWSTCYTFISSFLTSLVPERPQAPVNF